MTPEEEGRAAFEAGLAANPYDGRSREARRWVEGYTRGGATAEVFVARESGVATVNGKDMVFVKGVTRVAADSPFYKAYPQFFEPAIEQATAAPGEQRAR